MGSHPFSQVDVFSREPFRGNPVAVVHDADSLDDRAMARFANWTNLSETTFLQRPTRPDADYRLRIFTVSGELRFAGHPTLGSCRAWLDAGGTPRSDDEIVQECGAGLVRIRRDGDFFAFTAPPFERAGPVEEPELSRATAALGLGPDDVLHAQWVHNGPGWLGLVLRSADAVLALRPDFAALGSLDVGVIGRHSPDGPADYEVRAFVPGDGINEDPVTGSLNAGFGVWLIGAGLAPPSYTVRQGTALGRAGRVDVSAEGDDVWVGGVTTPRIAGTVWL